MPDFMLKTGKSAILKNTSSFQWELKAKCMSSNMNQVLWAEAISWGIGADLPSSIIKSLELVEILIHRVLFFH